LFGPFSFPHTKGDIKIKQSHTFHGKIGLIAKVEKNNYSILYFKKRRKSSFIAVYGK
jgi:hypothetical protein